MTIEDKIASRLFVKRWGGWSEQVDTDPATVWSQVLVPAVQGLGLAGKAAILRAVFEANDKETGTLVREMVQTKVKADAATEATAMLADDALSRAELEEIF